MLKINLLKLITFCVKGQFEKRSSDTHFVVARLSSTSANKTCVTETYARILATLEFTVSAKAYIKLEIEQIVPNFRPKLCKKFEVLVSTRK